MKLVLSDGEMRRQKERKTYNRVAEALEREARRVRRFEEVDKPAFERWVESELARELTALRDAERRVSELRGLIGDVRRYAELAGMSERRAYELLAAARKAGMEEALWQELYGKVRAEAHGSADDDEDEEDEGTGREPHEEDEPSRRGRRDWKRDEVEHGGSRGGAVTEYLKGLYRKLVRILHPDVQTDGGKATEKLWHEVQAAYEWADVQTMERIYKTVVKDGEEKPELSLETCPIGEIIALRLDMERRLAKMVREVERLKADEPGWDFSAVRRNPSRLRKLAARVADDMRSDLAQTERVASMLAKVVERWEKRDERGSVRRRRPDRR